MLLARGGSYPSRRPGGCAAHGFRHFAASAPIFTRPARASQTPGRPRRQLRCFAVFGSRRFGPSWQRPACFTPAESRSTGVRLRHSSAVAEARVGGRRCWLTCVGYMRLYLGDWRPCLHLRWKASACGRSSGSSGLANGATCFASPSTRMLPVLLQKLLWSQSRSCTESSRSAKRSRRIRRPCALTLAPSARLPLRRAAPCSGTRRWLTAGSARCASSCGHRCAQSAGSTFSHSHGLRSISRRARSAASRPSPLERFSRVRPQSVQLPMRAGWQRAAPRGCGDATRSAARLVGCRAKPQRQWPLAEQ